MDVPGPIATPSGNVNWKAVAIAGAVGIAAGALTFYLANRTRPWTGRAVPSEAVVNADGGYHGQLERFAALNPGHGWRELANKSADAHLERIWPLDNTPLLRSPFRTDAQAEANAPYQQAAVATLRELLKSAGFGAWDVRCVYLLNVLECGWSGYGCHGFNLHNANCGSVIYGDPDLIRQGKIWTGIPESNGIFLLVDRINHFKPYGHYKDFQGYLKYIARIFGRSYPGTIAGWTEGGYEGLMKAENFLATAPGGAWSGAGASARARDAEHYWRRMCAKFPDWSDRGKWNP